MTTILAVFLLSFFLSLLLTPLAGKLGLKIGAVDFPDKRKMHSTIMPRFGGPAIFFSILLSVIAAILWGSAITEELLADSRAVYLFLGGVIILFVGIVDDIRRLGPKIKFTLQIAACLLPYMAGLSINNFLNIDLGVMGHFIALPLTIFWFLLFINAVNLIDGLDGLAAGMVFFASLIMTILALHQEMFVLSFLFAALCGSLLGFLRYNFNPAKIFLGDGGSYFLGYCLAGLAIYGSVKSQVGSLMLVLMLMMGIPLMDTLITPLRRFLHGKRMFYPDKEHLHHRLISMGMTKQNAVLILYVATFVMCLLSVALVYTRNEMSALIIIVFSLTGAFFFRKVGYMDYLTKEIFLGWVYNLADTSGLSRDRRAFLDIQLCIEKTDSLTQCWEKVVKGLEVLGVDFAELYVSDKLAEVKGEVSFLKQPGSEMNSNTFTWTRKTFDSEKVLHKRVNFKMEIPLIANTGELMGIFWVVIDFKDVAPSPFVIRRIDQLRQSLTRQLQKLRDSGTREDYSALKPAAVGKLKDIKEG